MTAHAKNSTKQSQSLSAAMKNVKDFYGNGVVYLLDGENIDVGERACNFNIEADDGEGEFWITSEVVVALGSSATCRGALKGLGALVRRLEENGLDDIPEFRSTGIKS